MPNTAEIRIDDQHFEVPVFEGTEHERALDIRKLRGSTGLISLDDGYGNTGSCMSSITFINGEKGILHYRGYSIEDICAHSNFIEVCYLLIYGKLPTRAQYETFNADLLHHTMLHEGMKHFFDAYPHDAHPMAVLSSMICALSTFYQDSSDPENPEHVNISIRRLLAKIGTIAAYSFKKSSGQPMIYPDNSLSYCANFLKMMFSVPCEPYQVRPSVEHALEQLLMLHADHEQNCSTSTVRMVGSSRANLFAAVSAGVSALWGPLHGGANQQVLVMLDQIHQAGGDASKFIEKAKDKNDPFRLMGFGHRVYKNFDPRAQIIKKSSDALLKDLGIHDPLLEIAVTLEETALKDPYFVERKLFPNVDFYSGIMYRAMGIPTDAFTVLFAMGRLPGWIAQWKEMMDSKSRIYRPRQIYTGAPPRPYVPMDNR
ncbi:MAG: citrate synthase [Planctomycetota bacterium]